MFRALVALCGALSLPALAATYYVAPNGNDYGSGLYIGSPFKTVQKAVRQARAGDTVYIRGGVYRETVTADVNGGTSSAPIRIRNYGTEKVYIKGSDIVTGWLHHSGAIWKKTGWTINAQQVFVDFNDANPTAGPKPLQQIGMPSGYYSSWEYQYPVSGSSSSLPAGSFYFSKSSNTLYVRLADGSDPNKHRMEVSVRGRLVYLRKPYIILDGLNFRHSNASAGSQQGAAVELASYDTMQNCDVQFVDFAGVSMGYQQTGSKLLNSNLSNNGALGVTAPATKKFLVSGNRMLSNNYRRFNMLWHAGGFKSATDSDGIVENNLVAYNYGSGIWFDYSNSGQPITIRYNFVHHNGPKDSGIFLEATNNVLVHDNIVANNERRGIYLSAAWNVRVLNNTFVGNKGRATIELGGMPRSGAQLTNNQVVNNLLSHNTTQYELVLFKPNGTTIRGNTSNYNNFHRYSTLTLWYGSGISLSSFRSASGQDRNTLNVNPALVNSGNNPPAAANFKLWGNSPIINKGTNLTGTVTRDYFGTGRPRRGAYDIGAFEYP
jgi:parallel beta-helix repeat protein